MNPNKKKSVLKIQDTKERVQKDLAASLNSEGTIDLLKLQENNKPLSEIFDIITLSKTWRDDPERYAKDVARLLAARDETSDLSKALVQLENAMKKPAKKT